MTLLRPNPTGGPWYEDPPGMGEIYTWIAPLSLEERKEAIQRVIRWAQKCEHRCIRPTCAEARRWQSLRHDIITVKMWITTEARVNAPR